jgi:hypothetical protein
MSFSSLAHILLLNVHPANLVNPFTIDQLATSHTLLDMDMKEKMTSIKIVFDNF